MPLLPLISRILNRFLLIGLPSHRRRVSAARKAISRLASFEGDGQILSYLRKIDPLVFEELVLCLFERSGCLVLRNRSYSGDGGIDGRFWHPSTGWAAIQCKRHSRAIDPQSARKFALDCSSRKFRFGVFAHAGRSGPQFQAALESAGLLVLSGSHFGQAIRGEPLLPLLMDRKRRSSR